MKRPDWNLPYRIKRGQRGFCVWKFRDWDLERPGWRVLKAGLTSEEAEKDVLQRMGLSEPAQPPAPLELTYAWGWPFP